MKMNDAEERKKLDAEYAISLADHEIKKIERSGKCIADLFPDGSKERYRIEERIAEVIENYRKLKWEEIFKGTDGVADTLKLYALDEKSKRNDIQRMVSAFLKYGRVI